MRETIILIVDDLMFLPKLKNSLGQMGYRPLEATNESQLTRALFQAPVLVIVDLFSRGFDWPTLIRVIRKSKAGPVPILGFGPHVDLELRDKALKAGCNAVVGRGAVSGNLAHLVEKHKWKLDRTRCAEQPPELLLQGIALFNNGDYFECHEAIEYAWINEPEPVRIMYQGILQIGVACYHIKNKNWRGSMKLLERGMPKMERFAPVCMGIDLAHLLRDAEALRAELLRIGPEWQGEFNQTIFPVIRLSAPPETA
jgi:predicted metal-dependent hydrolase